MATKEITKQQRRYSDPDLEPGPIALPEDEDATESRRRTVAALGLLWEQRQSLYRWIAVGFVVSILIALLVPARFTSTTRLMPPDQPAGQGIASMLSVIGKSASAGGDLGAIGGDLFGLKTSGDLFVGVLRSRTIQDALINKFDLRKVYGDRRWEDARKHLDDLTDVVAERKSGIITIKVSDKNAERAAAMAREYVEQLNQIVITLNTSSAHKERVFLENRLHQVQEDLETAEKEFSQFASKNTTIDVKEQGRAMIGAAAELEGELIAAETQLEGLRQIYTPNNVRVRSVQARVDEYRRQLQKLGGKAPGDAAAGESSSGEESGVQAQDMYPSIRRLPILGVTWADLFRRAKIEEVVLETLTKQYELAKVEEAREVPSVKVLDVADLPERRHFMVRFIVMLVLTCFAGVLGTVWLLARDRWQEIDSNDPRKVLAQQVFQTVQTKPWISRALLFVRNGSSGGFHAGNHSASPEDRQQREDAEK